VSILNEANMNWHDDGHWMTVQIIGPELKVTSINCPHSNDPTKPCRHPRHGCIVETFINRYGLDCNVGSCPATSPITLCWTNVGDFEDIELMQIWVIPRNDDVFGSWLQIQNR